MYLPEEALWLFTVATANSIAQTKTNDDLLDNSMVVLTNSSCRSSPTPLSVQLHPSSVNYGDRFVCVFTVLYILRYIFLRNVDINRLAAVMISHVVPPTAEAFFQLVPVDGFC